MLICVYKALECFLSAYLKLDTADWNVNSGLFQSRNALLQENFYATDRALSVLIKASGREIP